MPQGSSTLLSGVKNFWTKAREKRHTNEVSLHVVLMGRLTRCRRFSALRIGVQQEKMSIQLAKISCHMTHDLSDKRRKLRLCLQPYTDTTFSSSSNSLHQPSLLLRRRRMSTLVSLRRFPCLSSRRPSRNFLQRNWRSILKHHFGRIRSTNSLRVEEVHRCERFDAGSDVGYFLAGREFLVQL